MVKVEVMVILTIRPTLTIPDKNFKFDELWPPLKKKPKKNKQTKNEKTIYWSFERNSIMYLDIYNENGSGSGTGDEKWDVLYNSPQLPVANSRHSWRKKIVFWSPSWRTFN